MTETEGGSGAPSWLTPEASDAIAAAVEAGNTVTTAVAAAGIDPAELYRWASEAGEADEVFRGFRDRLGQARARAELALVKAVVTDAEGGFLVRRYVKVFPDGTEETDESFAPPNGRIGLEWLKRRNRQQWDGQDMTSDMLGGDAASAAAGGPAAEAGTIEALAGRLHALMSARSEGVPQDEHVVTAGQVVRDQDTDSL